ncbi:RIP-like protein [Ptiloglossa arizonensis]|uniref:RIP-like protein n=1 Tax=Ptiloglossa arizonensis TaxID=3350558 RepID=UPI003FA06AD3
MLQCTEDMENITLSPTMTMKLKCRKSVNKIRHGSPKLQEVLRERCRQRMREKRAQLFNRSRFGLEINSKDVQEKLTEIVRKELSNIAATNLDPAVNPFCHVIDKPLDPEEALELEGEILNEEEQWILEEYEKMSQEEIEFLSLSADPAFEEIFCPMCQKSSLTQNVNQITCKSCTFRLNSSLDLKQFGHLLSKCVNAHSEICNQPPGFLELSEKNSTCIYLVCDKCSSFAPLE